MSETKSPGEGELPGPVDMDAQEYEAKRERPEGLESAVALREADGRLEGLSLAGQVQQEVGLARAGLHPRGIELPVEHSEDYEEGYAEARAEAAETLQRWIDWTRDGRELRRADLLKLRDELLS